MKEYKKAQEKAQLHGVVNDAYDHDKKQNTQSQNSNDYPKQEYKMNSIHDKIESVHETDQNDLGNVPIKKITRTKMPNIESGRYRKWTISKWVISKYKNRELKKSRKRLLLYKSPRFCHQFLNVADINC